MIGKVSTGNYFGGVIDYVKDKNKAQKIDSNMMSNSSKDLKKEFLLCADLKKNIKNRVKHFVISFSDEDKAKLNEDILRDITQDYLQEMNFTNNQYVAYLHNDTDKKHIHIIVNRIDFDGKVVKDGRDKKRSRASLMKLEKKYNLTRTQEKSLDKSKNFNKDEKEMIKRMKKKDKLTDKQIIKETIIKALEQGVKNENELKKTLQKNDIFLMKNKAGNGYNFEYKDKKYKASSVNRNLSFAKINQAFKENTQIFENDQKLEQQNNSLSL